MLRRSIVVVATLSIALVGMAVPASAAEQPVTGVIADSNGPVAGAGVCLSGPFPVCSTATGADGRFSLPVSDGHWTFTVAPSTFVFPPATPADFPPRTFELTVAATGPNDAGTIVVARWASVSGRVFQPDGITPVQGANVGRPCPPTCTTPAFTNASGAFTISRLAPGTVTLVAQAPVNGMLPLWYPKSIEVSLASGENVTGRDISLTAGAVVSGRITDPDGDPVPAGTSVIWQVGTTSMGVVSGTAADGSYTTPALPPGSVLTITAGPTETGAATTSSPQALAAGTPVTVNLTLGAGGWVLGRVTSSAGAAAQGAFVSLSLDGCVFGPGVACPAVSATTATDGTYRLPAMAPGGTFTLRVQPRFDSLDRPATRTGITLTAGTGRVEDVALTPDTVITGVLSNATGTPVGGVTVSACPTPAMTPCQFGFANFGTGVYLIRS
ncbi:MAG: carboxypeptidase regulatory-like domain-containing protein, partial [Acidimicrobiia bacterium]